MADPAVEQEIATLVREAIARHGMAGEVSVRGANVVLEGNGPTVSTELGMLAAQWDVLPHDVRVRRATEIARRLFDARRSLSARPPPRTGLGLVWLGPIALVALAAAGLWGAYRLLPGGSSSGAPHDPSPSVTSSADVYEAERVARAARVCSATRERVLRGASVAMTDAEGWVIELVLLRPGDAAAMRRDPALATFFAFDSGHDTARLVWAGTPALSELDDAFTRVRFSDADPEPTHARTRGLRLTFSGGYVSPYFDADRRGLFHKLASALAERLAVTYGALYARCADRDSHEIGSWFRATAPSTAAASLVFFMDTYADVPHVRAALLRPPGSSAPIDRDFALGEIERKTSALRFEQLRTLLGEFGGAIAGRPEGPTTVTFDFRDASRAARASYRVAREVKIADLP